MNRVSCRGFHAQESAELLVSALFQSNVLRVDGIPGKDEMAAASARITHWLDDLFVRK